MEDNSPRKVNVYVGVKPLKWCFPPDFADVLKCSNHNRSAAYACEATTLNGIKVKYTIDLKINGSEKSVEHSLHLGTLLLELREETGRFRGGSTMNVLKVDGSVPESIYFNSYQIEGSHYDRLKSNHRSIEGSSLSAVAALTDFAVTENTELHGLFSMLPNVFRSPLMALCKETNFPLPVSPAFDVPAADADSAVECICLDMGIRRLADCFFARTDRMRAPPYATATYKVTATTLKGARIAFTERPCCPTRAPAGAEGSEGGGGEAGKGGGEDVEVAECVLVLHDIQLVATAPAGYPAHADADNGGGAAAGSSLTISRLLGDGQEALLYSAPAARPRGAGPDGGGGGAAGCSGREDWARVRGALEALAALAHHEGLRLSQLVAALPAPLGGRVGALCEAAGMAPARIELRLGVRPLADCFPPAAEELRFYERAVVESEAVTARGGARVRLVEDRRDDLGRRRYRAPTPARSTPASLYSAPPCPYSGGQIWRHSLSWRSPACHWGRILSRGQCGGGRPSAQARVGCQSGHPSADGERERGRAPAEGGGMAPASEPRADTGQPGRQRAGGKEKERDAERHSTGVRDSTPAARTTR